MKMKISVIKFGGSSLKDNAAIETAVSRLLEHQSDADRVLVVVSAMGRFPSCYATDTLASLASHLSPKDKDRLMAMGEMISSLVFVNCCLSHSIKACALNIAETGILTDDNYQRAHVLGVSTKKIIHAFKEHEVVVVPGFTGTSLTGNTVTLGRGGSDYSAFLIAKALEVPFVSIYTDVKGVYDKDPRKNPEAVLYDALSYDRLLDLIDNGAKVMQKDSVLYAKEHQIAFEVRSTFECTAGTFIGPIQTEAKEAQPMQKDSMS